MVNKQNIISFLIILSMVLYVYGYDISHHFYNQYDYPQYSELRKSVANDFWDLRFSLYSVIIAVIYFIAQSSLNKFNIMLSRISFNFALFSAIDKLVFRDYSFNEYDNIILISIIIIEICIYKIKK